MQTSKQDFPPFGFSVFFNRHGKRWCWVDRRAQADPDDIMKGEGYRSRAAANQGARDELRRRGERDAARQITEAEASDVRDH